MNQAAPMLGCAMLPLLAVVGVALLLVGLWWLLTYNGLVRLRQHVREAWSNIDTELQRRYDLIPNLVEAVRGYAAHERALFERVAVARTAARDEAGGVERQAQRETELTRALRPVLAVAEAYPELKASQHFLKLQQELTNTEDRIQAARRFYNANVRDLNTRVESVPSNLVAGMGDFRREAFFEIETAARAVPVV